MRHTHTISGLRDKRARLAGEIKAAEKALAERRDELAALDTTLLLFHPDTDPAQIPSIRPSMRDLTFRRGEKRRLVLEALRKAGGPLSTRGVTDYVMRLRGIDPGIRREVQYSMRQGLSGLWRLGMVRKLMSEPEAWWDLAR